MTRLTKEEQERLMSDLARMIDRWLNGEREGEARRVGFALLTYEFGKLEGGRVNYIGNGARDDVRVALKELLARWEGRAVETAGRG